MGRHQGSVRYRRLLVGTDFSPTASFAVARAALLAVERDAELFIAHAVRTFPSALLKRLGVDQLDALEAGHVQRGLAAARRLAAGLGARVAVGAIQGGSASALLVQAKRLRSDLIVVGHGGGRSLGQGLIGTTAERLIERGHHNVLLVKKAPKTAYQRALICVADAPIAKKILADSAALASQAELRLIHAYEPLFERKLRSNELPAKLIAEHTSIERRKAKATLERLLREHPLPGRQLRSLVRKGFPSDVILRAAKTARADLVVVGKNRSVIEDLLIGSVTKRVLRSAAMDVMVVAAPA